MDVASVYQTNSDLLKASQIQTDNLQNNNNYNTVSGLSGTNGTNAEEEKPAAVYEPSKKEYTVDMDQVRRMIQESNDKAQAFRKMIEALLNKQGVTYEEAMRRIDSGEVFTVEVDEETRKKAQADISEDGYYGVKQTSQRILDFAKAISGGDPSKIEMLRDAVKEGFKSAEDAWGGKLPDISYQTYDAVMKGFDEWAESAKG